MSIAYKTKEITPGGLVRVYEASGVFLKGSIVIRISTGEPGGYNFLQPGLVKDLVNRLSGTIVECSTTYPGRRSATQAHWGTIRDHGSLAIAPYDILDEDDDMAIPVEGGFHLQEDYVGTHLKNCDSVVMLSHLGGHAMSGFGGALEDISIDLASSRGKVQTHMSGTSNVFEDAFTADRDSFLESVADADRPVANFMGREKIAHINMANRLSVDCGCDTHPHDPEMADIDIFASADPVALDQASVDAVYGSEDAGKRVLIECMEFRHGIHIVEAVQAHGLGDRKHKLVRID